MEKIFLGSHVNYGLISLEKHKWDCGWYWAFGYVGNNRCHFHFKSMLDSEITIYSHLKSTWITQDQWWILRDLFIFAYSLKETAACYIYGGHQTSAAEPYRIKNQEMANKLNADLEKILDNIWNLLIEWKSKQDV